MQKRAGECNVQNTVGFMPIRPDPEGLRRIEQAKAKRLEEGERIAITNAPRAWCWPKKNGAEDSRS